MVLRAATIAVVFAVLFGSAGFWGCADLASGQSITTGYGFSVSQVVREFGAVDSLRVWVVVEGDTAQQLRLGPDSIDAGGLVQFHLEASAEQEVLVEYRIWAGGETAPVAAGRQLFQSGTVPKIALPSLRPMVSACGNLCGAGGGLQLVRGTEYALPGKDTSDWNATVSRYRWDFDGDGTWDEQDVENLPGSFTLRLDSIGTSFAIFRAENALGLFDQDTVALQVVPRTPTLRLLPDTVVSVGDTVRVRGLLVLDDSTRMAQAQLVWSVGGVADSCLLAESGCLPAAGRPFAWSLSGEQQVSLIVADGWGNSVSAQARVQVLQDAPVVEVSADPALAEVRVHVSLLGRASQQFGAIARYGWDFDGDTTGGVWDTLFTQEQSVLHAYAIAGDYAPLFFAEDDDGNLTVAVAHLAVFQPSHPPQILFWSASDTIVTVYDQVDYTLNTFFDARGPLDIKKFQWDYDGNGTWDRTNTVSRSTGKRFGAAGTYATRLRIEDANGDFALDSVRIHVLSGAPTVEAGPSLTTGNSQQLRWTASATDWNIEGAMDAADGTLINYEWDCDGNGTLENSGYGLGGTSSGNFQVACTFPDTIATKSYRVRVCATDDDTQVGCDSVLVTASNRPPVLPYSGIQDNQGSATYTVPGDTIRLRVDPIWIQDPENNRIDSLWWDLDNDGTWEVRHRTADTVLLVGDTVGLYTVRVRAVDRWRAEAIATTTLRMAGSPANPCSGGQFSDDRGSSVRLYSCATIAGRSWMTQNLDYGTRVAGTNNQLQDGLVEKYCFSNLADSCTVRGGLYQWAEALALPYSCNSSSCADAVVEPHRGICPDGWHIPTRSETVEFIALGASALKTTAGWDAWGNGTDASGFHAAPTGLRRTAPPGGLEVFRFENGSFGMVLSGEYSASGAKGFGLTSEINFSGNVEKLEGRSVRCVKD
jgi:uncharacterized protein (TIGR02145 family)